MLRTVEFGGEAIYGLLAHILLLNRVVHIIEVVVKAVDFLFRLENGSILSQFRPLNLFYSLVSTISLNCALVRVFNVWSISSHTLRK